MHNEVHHFLLGLLDDVQLFVDVRHGRCNKEHSGVTHERVQPCLPGDAGFIHCRSQQTAAVFECSEVGSGRNRHLVVPADGLTLAGYLLHGCDHRFQSRSECGDAGKGYLRVGL